MKKIMMIAVLAVAALSANAQMWVGGSIGFSTDKTKAEDIEVSSGTNVDLSPEVGYNLNEKWAVGMALSYGHYSAKTYTYAGESVSGMANQFSIRPFVRYTYVKVGNFSAFCDGLLTYGTAHIQGMDNNFNESSVGIAPGISYAISPKISLVAILGGMSYEHDWYKVNDNVTIKTNKFNFGISNAIRFGAIVNL